MIKNTLSYRGYRTFYEIPFTHNIYPINFFATISLKAREVQWLSALYDIKLHSLSNKNVIPNLLVDLYSTSTLHITRNYMKSHQITLNYTTLHKITQHHTTLYSNAHRYTTTQNNTPHYTTLQNTTQPL